MQVFDQQEEQMSEKIDPNFADLVDKNMHIYIKAAKQKLLLKKYVRPENCTSLVVSTINKAMWSTFPKCKEPTHIEFTM